MKLVDAVADLRKLIDDGQIERGIIGGVPVPEPLRPLLPGGLSRAAPTVIAPTPGATSLVHALLAEASRTEYCAVIGTEQIGALAIQHMGGDLRRIPWIPRPGTDWPTIVDTAAAGVGLVVVYPPARLSLRLAERLRARARQRHCALVIVGDPGWPGAGTVLTTSAPRWYGLDAGRGRLKRRALTIAAAGRGGAERQVSVWLPAPDGRIRTVEHTRLVGRWWSGLWGRHRILVRLERGDTEWLVTRDGPDGAEHADWYGTEWQARAAVDRVLADARYGWREVPGGDYEPASAEVAL